MIAPPPVARRSMLLHGLRLLITRPGPVLWTYFFNLALALVFSLRLHAQLASILDHSLAAERLNSAFDLGTLYSVIHRLSYNAPSTGSTSFAGLPLYLICYFILVPGSLVSYATGGPSGLSTLLANGLSYFWRFVRITLFTLLGALVILGPLMAAQSAWATHVDDTSVGRPAFLATAAGWIVIFLVAALLRLYFDLVEVYAVQLAGRPRPNGKPDRRVRRTLLPAWRTLRANFGRAYLTFLVLTLLGFLAVAFTGRIAMHMLAQPRVWPMFLLAQAGLFAMLATRFWQRAAETILAADNPIPYPLPPPPATPPPPPFNPPVAPPPPPTPSHLPSDAQPDPEPAAPSLPEPDPGVFHHDAGNRDQGTGNSS